MLDQQSVKIKDPIRTVENNESNWEYGSENHWLSEKQLKEFSGDKTIYDLYPDAALHSTGCSVIRSVLWHGIANRGWKTIWMPSYFIKEVIVVIQGIDIEIKFYHDNPLMTTPGLPTEKLTSEDVVFRMNYFGWRGAEAILSSQDIGCDIIEDHCHDFIGAWATQSQATYCLTTLRKLYPLPDGAILWSPQGEEVPEAPATTDSHLAAVQKKLSGMLLKQFYLNGCDVAKEEFRKGSLDGEDEIGGTNGVSGACELSKHLFSVLSITKLSKLRNENFETFKKLASPSVKKYLAWDTIPADSYIFSIVFLFDSESQRDLVKAYLIQNKVYPATFWDWPTEYALDDPEGKDFSDRMLSIHCDFRYNADDIQKMLSILERAIEGFK